MIEHAGLHPFDLRAALLARHAQHVVLIHFPIALCLAGVAFDAASSWTRRQGLAAAAYYNLAVAAFSTLPVVATGLLAWRFQLEGQRLRGTLLLHLVLGVLSSVAICGVWWLHFRARRVPGRPLPAYRLPIELLTVALVALTGHLGGFLSGVNGPGQ
jgi:uncharacterized membrane protein